MKDGTTRPSPLYGPNGAGYLIYSDTGRMCAILTDPHRAKWKSEESPTETELRSTFDHFVAYSGRYEVNAAQGFVIHYVEMDLNPNNIGSILKRYISFDGKLLKLRPAEKLAKDVIEYTLTWQRVENSAANSDKLR